ncbi:hypothetical protein [Halostagnicola kamekurae]|uniref:Uncharacterized protein n=1 Tax=Halostagnicola kamekurae TaxID=619731 RepID=A0A1I6QWT5_9EURY|nr:hypothetical protein [Halostagnicola kamekurae]SFS56862.1 hypothetical protein SAMN04488556_1649 [Halostagnicola kamekurae]
MDSLRAAISETWDKQGKVGMTLVCGAFAGIGGLTANSVVPHFVASTAAQAILGGLIAGGAVLVGVAIFTLINQIIR